MAETHHFQAEIKQLLHILIHSLYKDRDIFLRELISNASDALSKVQFEMLTNRDILDPDLELGIEIATDAEARTIRISDTGIGMTEEEAINNLGVIARSGARSFAERLKEMDTADSAATLIGQFGVGFYSVFMVADRVEVISRSIQPDAEAVRWVSNGEDSYEVTAADKATRGTDIVIYLREDAAEFANDWKIREIIKRHSDYIAFPIYMQTPAPESDTDEAEAETPAREPINQRTALWRRSASELSDEEYNDFYRMFTLDFEPPALRIHTQADAPIQYYALLYVPKKAERNVLSLRREAGLKLYVRKVLIQEYSTDLLPDYLQFVQGVVDSEDLPLNVSRETVQANPQMTKLKQALTRRILNEFSKIANNDAETYGELWSEYSAYLKHGVVSDYAERERLLPLLRFRTSERGEAWVSLDEYVEAMAEGQDKIYYIIADTQAAANRSPHLDPFRARQIEVLFLTETVDGFLVSALRDYKGHQLVSIDSENLDLEGVGTAPAEDEQAEPVPQDALDQLIVRMRNILGEQVKSVRVSKVTASGSPTRLVAPEGTLDRHTQRVYQMLEREVEVQPRILEVNPRHTIIRNLAARLERDSNDPLLEESILTLYQSALLADGLHPNPADVVAHIQALMEAATQI